MYLEALQEKVCGSIQPSQRSSELLLWGLYGFAFSSPFLMTLDIFAQSGIDIGKLLREKKKSESKQKRKQKKEKKRAQKEGKKAKKEGEKRVWHTKKHLVSIFSKNRFKLGFNFFFFTENRGQSHIHGNEWEQTLCRIKTAERHHLTHDSKGCWWPGHWPRELGLPSRHHWLRLRRGQPCQWRH